MKEVLEMFAQEYKEQSKKEFQRLEKIKALEVNGDISDLVSSIETRASEYHLKYMAVMAKVLELEI